MPYIKQEIRETLSTDLDKLIESIKTNDLASRKGICNYVISKIVFNCMKPDTGWRYSSLSDASSVFKDAGIEFDRRVMAPYEDAAKEKNGDIYND